MNYKEVSLSGLDDLQQDIVNAVINEGILRESERVKEQLQDMRNDAILARDKPKETFIENIMRELGYIS